MNVCAISSMHQQECGGPSERLDRGAVAYLAGAFPARSETFVYREVRELQRRGWLVRAVALHPSPDAEDPCFAEDVEHLTVLYASRSRMIADAGAELIVHPFRSAMTLATGLMDATRPGESLSPIGRAKALAQVICAWALARKLRKAATRHIHCHFAHAPTTVGMYAARQLGITFSFTGHANDIFQRRCLLGAKLRRASFVSCISEWHRLFYESIHPDTARKYRVIRCGVDVNEWRPTSRDRSADDPLHVLTVCRLVPKKGVEFLIRGLYEFHRRTGRAWQLTIAGDGPQRPTLELMTRQLGCSAAIQWLGAIGNDAVRSAMRDADVFALTCVEDEHGDRDGIPVVLMEAMACGMPVLAGDLPAIRELVEDGVTGLCVDGRDVSCIAQRIAELDRDAALRERLGTAARHRIETEFSLDSNVSRIEAALEEAIGEQPIPLPAAAACQ